MKQIEKDKLTITYSKINVEALKRVYFDKYLMRMSLIVLIASLIISAVWWAFSDSAVVTFICGFLLIGSVFGTIIFIAPVVIWFAIPGIIKIIDFLLLIIKVCCDMVQSVLALIADGLNKFYD